MQNSAARNRKNLRFWAPKSLLASLPCKEEFKEDEENDKAYIRKQQLTYNLMHSVYLIDNDGCFV